jgi:hypothetical protein
VGTSNVIRLLTKLSFGNGESIFLPDGTRFFLFEDVLIVLEDFDPWVNSEFKNGESLGHKRGLAEALGSFLLEKAWAK